MARPQINEYFFKSNKSYQNWQDDEIGKIAEKLADMEPETWYFTLTNGTELAKKILVADVEEEETADETPEAE